ncbi:unnamed protein product, partial [Iphiclides podalirius]
MHQCNEIFGYLQLTIEFNDFYPTVKTFLEVLMRKRWHEDNYRLIFIDVLRTILQNFSCNIHVLDTKLYSILNSIVTNGAWVLSSNRKVLLDTVQAAQVRQNSAIAAAAYRHATDIGLLRLLPELFHTEVVWANVNAPTFARRVAGRPLSLASWVNQNGEFFEILGSCVLLPIIEMLGIWHIVTSMSQDNRPISVLLELLQIVEQSFSLDNTTYSYPLSVDGRVAIAYIMGCCLAEVGLHELAIVQLRKVSRLRHRIEMDYFFVPLAMFELALCYDALGDRRGAHNQLMLARYRYVNIMTDYEFLYHVYAAAVNLVQAPERDRQELVRQPPPSNPPSPNNSRPGSPQYQLYRYENIMRNYEILYHVYAAAVDLVQLPERDRLESARRPPPTDPPLPNNSRPGSPQYQLFPQ